MMMQAINSLPYRSGVGIALFNAGGLVFVGERIDTPGAWQMPQGGVDPGESIEQAARREMREEIGTDEIEILEITREPLRYDLPSDLQKALWGGLYRGQEQHWVAARFTGKDSDIDIAAHDLPEFSAWQWVELSRLCELIVPFKRDVYTQVIDIFKKYG